MGSRGHAGELWAYRKQGAQRILIDGSLFFADGAPTEYPPLYLLSIFCFAVDSSEEESNRACLLQIPTAKLRRQNSDHLRNRLLGQRLTDDPDQILATRSRWRSKVVKRHLSD